MKNFRRILLCLIVACFAFSFASCSPEPEHQHQFGDWQIVTEASCFQDGLLRRVCACSEEETKVSPMFGSHDYIETSRTESTCTELGQIEYSCSRCGDFNCEELPLGDHTYSSEYSSDENGHWKSATCFHSDLKKDYEEHSFGNWQTIEEATCENDGLEKRVCVCGYFEEKITESSGHTYSEELSFNEDGHFYLATCEHADLQKDFENHQLGDFETYKPSSCTEDGEERKTCSCGYYISNILPKTGHSFEEEFDYDKTYHWKNATCEHLNEKKDYARHEFSDWKTIREKTCEKDGLKKRACACGYFEEQIIETTGHTFDTEYSYDFFYHYYKSNCEHYIRKSESSHTYGADGKCSICGREEPKETANLSTNYYSITGIGNVTDSEIVTPVYLPNSTSKYNEISNYAFQDALITGIKITDNIKSIGNMAFYNCRNLEYVYIGSGVTSIGSSAFAGTNVKRVYVDDINTWLNIIFADFNANPLYFGADLYVNGELVTEVTVNNQYTTKINDYVFAGYQKLERVNLPTNVWNIGKCAFLNTTNLKTINLENIQKFSNQSFAKSGIENLKLTSTCVNIEDFAFDGAKLKSIELGYSSSVILGFSIFNDCRDLTTLTINDGVTKIGDEMFQNCSALTEAVFPDSLETIRDYAFMNCSALSKIVISSGVTAIGGNAFYGCFKLYEVYDLSSSITVEKGSTSNGYVGYYAKKILTSLTDTRITDANGFVFDYIEDKYYLVGYVGSLAEITLPENVGGEPYVLYPYAFASATSLEKVNIKGNITEIPNGAFYRLPNLKEVVIESEIETIGSYAFANTPIEQINLPESLLTISDYAFLETKLTEIIFPNKLVTIGDFAFAGSLLKEIIIPDSVTEIGSHAFQLCEQAERIIIGNGVTELFAAFRDCNSCTELVIGENVKDIGWYSFSFIRVETLVIPDSVVSIGDSAFAGCIDLKKLYIGTGLISTFCSFNASTEGAPSPDEIHIKDLSKYLSIQFDNTYGSPVRSNTKIFVNGELLQGTLVVPEDVIVIGEQVLQNYQYITEVILHDGVEEIGESAFANCINLSGLVIGKSVKNIGSLAFYNCYNLVEIYNLSTLNIKRSTNSSTYGYLQQYVYQVHNSLDTPSSKVVVDGYIFLKPLQNEMPILLGYQGESKDLILPLTFNDKGYNINAYAFYGRQDIESLTITGEVRLIGESAFQNTSLKSIILTPSVSMAINKNAFRNCLNAKTLVIGDYVITIEERAFSGLESVTSDIFLSTRLTTVGNYAFSGLKANIKIGHSNRPTGWKNTSLAGVTGSITWGVNNQ